MKKLIDTQGNIHNYDPDSHLLGEGGQGAVYRTLDGDVAIKIDNSNLSLENFKARIGELIFLPLPRLDLIMPLVPLRDEKGYVMRVLDNFIPLKKFTKEGINLEDFSEANMSLFLKIAQNQLAATAIAHYCQSGGLRIRLFILQQIALILSRLHLRGLVYCDLSPNNVFIEDASDAPAVRLIDADNVEYQGRVKSSIFTPNYEVPEIESGSVNSLYSDLWAFATLAFYLLTMTYPFAELANDAECAGGWDDDSHPKPKWANPWIEDSRDSSCKNNEGLRGVFSTAPLKDLFIQTFEDGKENPHKRAILPLWVSRLESAINDTLKCDKCGMSYYDYLLEKCPYCQADKPLRVVVEGVDKSGGKKRFIRELTKSKKCEIPLSLIESERLDSFGEVAFSLECENDILKLEKKTHRHILEINKKEIFAKYTRKITECEGLEIKINEKILRLRILGLETKNTALSSPQDSQSQTTPGNVKGGK